MLIEELQAISADPRSWIVVGLMILVAGHSVVTLLICPYSHGTAKISDDQVHSARSAVFTPGTRFGLMMVAGIALTLGGLFMIASGTRPTLALLAMVAGLVITQTEPVRLQIRESKTAVVANRDAEAMVLDLQRDRLHSGQKELATTNMLLLIALTAGLLAF